MAHRLIGAGIVLLLLIPALTACSSSGGADPAPSTSTPHVTATSGSSSPTVTPSSSTSPADDPRAKGAETAYLGFVKASYAAERAPKNRADAKPLESIAIDPALGTEQGQLINFGVNDVEWRGTPPSSRTSVMRTAFNAQPYPSVDLIDCPTISRSWRPYSAANGKPLKLVTPKVAPPWATSATVVLYKGTWMVRSTKTDMTRTCQP